MAYKMLAAIRRRKINGQPVSFSLAIDITKCVKVLDVSTTFKYITGSAFRNHMIDTTTLQSEQIEVILD